MMRSESSAILEFGAPEPGETGSTMEGKLRFHTDSWDLSSISRLALTFSWSLTRAPVMRTSPATFQVQSTSDIAR
jgi:hypothetical protein